MRYAMQVSVVKNVYVVIDAREMVEDLIYKGDTRFNDDFERAMDNAIDGTVIVDDAELEDEQIDWYLNRADALDFLEYSDYVRE